MVNRNLIRSLDDDDIVNELAVLAPEEEADEWLLDWLEQDQQDYAQGEIVDGRIVEVNDEWALIDVGFKSEGTVSLNEWSPNSELILVSDSNHVFNAKHPWNCEVLPDSLKLVVERSIRYL